VDKCGRGHCNKDARAWLHYRGIKEEAVLVKKDYIKNNITSKFKDKLLDDKELKGKIKLLYYKEVINPTLANKNYLVVLTSAKKKMNIVKIRTNSHEIEVKPDVGLFPKHHGIKVSVTFTILKGLKTKVCSLGFLDSFSHQFYYPTNIPHYQCS